MDTSKDFTKGGSPDNQEHISDNIQQPDSSSQTHESLDQDINQVTDSITSAAHFSTDKSTYTDSADEPSARTPSDFESTKQPYVRQHRAHKTVEPINDFVRTEEDEASTMHDSSFTLGKGGRGSKSWRKSNNEIAQLRKDLHYGQYLQVPKGQRDIFVKKERRSNAGSLIAAVVVLIIIAIVIYFLWTWMSTNWGTAIR